MKKLFYLMAAATLLFSVVRAEAEDFDDAACSDKCYAAQSACEASINLPNDIEVLDAKAACAVAKQACDDACDRAKEKAKFGDTPTRDNPSGDAPPSQGQ